MPRLTVRTQLDAQRLRCPRNHVVAPTNQHWYCAACSRAWEDVETEFERVRDAKTGQMLARADVRFEGAAATRRPA